MGGEGLVVNCRPGTEGKKIKTYLDLTLSYFIFWLPYLYTLDTKSKSFTKTRLKACEISMGKIFLLVELWVHILFYIDDNKSEKVLTKDFKRQYAEKDSLFK